MSNAGVIGGANIDDLDQVVNLENKCFNGKLAYSRRQLRYLMTQANSDFLTEKLNDTMRGFIVVLYRDGTNVASIETINVDPNCRGNGIGYRLLKAAEDKIYHNGAKKIRLEVRTNNNEAIKLYEKAGFKKIQLLEDYYHFNYSGSKNAYRMIKELY